MKKVEIPYTICFCCYHQQVLMLYRTFSPNAQLWNGLGGKIEAGETPLASIKREMQEEAGIDLTKASSLFFAGIASWGLAGHDPVKGMYVFLAQLTSQQVERVDSLQTPEGFITWKPLAWACNPSNKAVVSNIPRFLPPMLEAQTPFEYFFTYASEDSPDQSFQELIIRPISPQIELSECQGWSNSR